MNSASPLGDVVICLWFALAAVAFWGPYLSAALPVGPLNALYAVFLLVSLTALALRFLRPGQRSDAETAASPSVHSPKEDALRRGR
jgi:hypothetical protein